MTPSGSSFLPAYLPLHRLCPNATIRPDCRVEQSEIAAMSEGLIEQQDEFEQFLNHIRESGIVAFDSEFVSEYTYRPQLCLLQLATHQRCVAVDPFRVADLSSWWQVMADDETTVVVHSGQAEVKFCLEHCGRRPQKLIDVQIAEGLHSCSYPVGYESLVRRVLDQPVYGRETRTDWRRRPLSKRQIHYALEDVEHILPIWERQQESLRQLDRHTWAEDEFQRMIDTVEAELARESWERLSGFQKLRIREFAVARELAEWREQQAERLNQPARRILRDDLVIELARRQPKTVPELLQTRDMTRPNYKRAANDLLQCIQRAMALPKSELTPPPAGDRTEKNRHEQVLGQLLGLALSNRCAEAGIARQLLGTSADLRHLLRRHVFGDSEGPPARLATGWRAEVCGNLLTDLMDGKVTIRVTNPTSDDPLVFERIEHTT